MSGGKGGGSSTTVQTPSLTQEQKDAIKAQTGMLTDIIIPSYKNAVGGAADVYNKTQPGLMNAAQNLATEANANQQILGNTGESALRTGITGLESLFNPQYEQTQIASALAPAQAQYMQNIANQQAQFGGAGQLGSPRQALAGQQLAGMNAANQANIAAQVESNIAGQRAAVANQLANLGQSGLGQATGMANQQVTAAMTPQQLYNQYASVIFGTPSASYNPNFAGTQGQTTSQSGSNWNLGFKI